MFLELYSDPIIEFAKNPTYKSSDLTKVFVNPSIVKLYDIILPDELQTNIATFLLIVTLHLPKSA